MPFKIKRAYEAPTEDDGERILVDHLWPRGVTKEEARISEWAKRISPSTELRQWFGHDPEKWTEFKKRYAKELAAKKEEIDRLLEKARHGAITLVYAAKDEEHNNAVFLKEYLEKRLE